MSVKNNSSVIECNSNLIELKDSLSDLSDYDKCLQYVDYDLNENIKIRDRNFPSKEGLTVFMNGNTFIVLSVDNRKYNMISIADCTDIKIIINVECKYLLMCNCLGVEIVTVGDAIVSMIGCRNCSATKN